MRNIPAGLLALLRSRSTTLCMCLVATRQDGAIYGFTDHDRDLTVSGTLCLASTSFTGSAIEDQLGLAVSNLDLKGPFLALSSIGITDNDLEDGRWDGADLRLLVVNWADPTQFAVLMRGTIGQVNSGDLAFQAELRSVAQAFAQYIGSLLQPKCRSNLGDTSSGPNGGCRFTMPAPVLGTISAVTDRGTFTVTAVGSFPDGTGGTVFGGYWAFGTITFTNGTNIGISREVSTSNPALDMVTVIPFPEDIQVGDAVSMQIGCDKTLETCAAIFDNVVNFRGEPYIPGSDAVFRVNT